MAPSCGTSCFRSIVRIWSVSEKLEVVVQATWDNGEALICYSFCRTCTTRSYSNLRQAGVAVNLRC